MSGDIKAIKCANVIRRALGEVVSGPVSASDEVDPTSPAGSVDPRLVQLVEAADLYSASV